MEKGFDAVRGCARERTRLRQDTLDGISGARRARRNYHRFGSRTSSRRAAGLIRAAPAARRIALSGTFV